MTNMLNKIEISNLEDSESQNEEEAAFSFKGLFKDILLIDDINYSVLKKSNTIKFIDIIFNLLQKDIFDIFNLEYNFFSNFHFCVSILIADKAYIQRLNYEYRKQDYPTDILSFSQLSYLDIKNKLKNKLKNKELILGDLVICPDIVKENALNFNVSYNEELLRIIIHGIMHLIGLDHKENFDHKENKKELKKENGMFFYQENILNKVIKIGVSFA